MYMQLVAITLFILEKVKVVNEFLQKIHWKLISNWNVMNHPNQSITLLCWSYCRMDVLHSCDFLKILFATHTLAVIYPFRFPVSLPFYFPALCFYLYEYKLLCTFHLLAKFTLYMLSSHFKPFSIHLQNKLSTSFLDLFAFWQ